MEREIELIDSKKQTETETERDRKRNQKPRNRDKRQYTPEWPGHSVWGRPRTFLFEPSWIPP